MAAAIASNGVAQYGGADVPRPSAVVMANTAHSDDSSAEPPNFVVVGEEDPDRPSRDHGTRVQALRKSGRDRLVGSETWDECTSARTVFEAALVVSR